MGRKFVRLSGRRRPRRSRDSRASADLYRRHAGHDRTGNPRCRNAKSRNDDRRDRQGGRRFPRRSRSRRCSRCSIPNRTTTSAITISICRSTFRQCSSSAPPTRWTTISPPLRDRMEIITLSGYTEFEKLQIAKRYLVKKQRETNGLRESQVQISDAGDPGDHQRLHARSRRAKSRTRDRYGVPQESRVRSRRARAIRRG